MQITRIKTLWPEDISFRCFRADTKEDHIFIHFLTPAILYRQDGTTEKIREGGCLLFPAHSYQNFTPDGCRLVHDWFHMVGDAETLLGTYGLVPGKVYQPVNHDFVTGILQSIELEYTRSDTFCREVIDAKLNELFAKIARNSADNRQPLPDPDTVRRFRAFRARMLSEYAGNWDVDLMAAENHLSRSRFNVLYHTIFRTSPKADLTAIRIEHAKNLLTSTGLPVAEIAVRVGFTDEYNFIRRFKSSTGQTPGTFRAENR